ncbi:MAG: hypothetical protein LDL27_13520, partial [Desulfovibrio sp.]|nr:hypothetical protein [Desulfovibrio sp.]
MEQDIDALFLLAQCPLQHLEDAIALSLQVGIIFKSQRRGEGLPYDAADKIPKAFMRRLQGGKDDRGHAILSVVPMTAANDQAVSH